MQLRKLFYLLLILPILFLNTACSDDDDNGTGPIEEINESEVLAKYIEALPGGVKGIQAMAKAKDVNGKILAGATDQFVIDIRQKADYDDGHIKGAVHVELKDIVTYYETNDLSKYATVVIACYTGQTAGFATALLRVLGYTNVKDLKWGMCSWNPETAARWNNTIANGNAYASQFSTTSTDKNPAGELPLIETGKKTGEEILRARIDQLLADEGNSAFGNSAVKASDVFASLDKYYVVNYWVKAEYDLGHIPGAVQFDPAEPSDFAFSKYLNTLPTDKEVVVYCYTGQTSAHMAAYLRILGYDGRSLVYGVNSMSYDIMIKNQFTSAETHDYELVK